MKTIAEHPLPLLQGGHDYILDMLRPGGHKKEEFGTGGDGVRTNVQEHFPDFFPQRRTTRLIVVRQLNPLCCQIFAGHFYLGGFAATFNPFKGNKSVHRSRFPFME